MIKTIINFIILLAFEGSARNWKCSFQAQGQGLDLRGQGHSCRAKTIKFALKARRRPRSGLED